MSGRRNHTVKTKPSEPEKRNNTVFANGRNIAIPICHGVGMEIKSDRFKCRVCGYVVQNNDLWHDSMVKKRLERLEQAMADEKARIEEEARIKDEHDRTRIYRRMC